MNFGIPVTTTYEKFWGTRACWPDADILLRRVIMAAFSGHDWLGMEKERTNR
jgi:hypothetical protein